jgi:hypothetical protein
LKNDLKFGVAIKSLQVLREFCNGSHDYLSVVAHTH